MKKIILVAMAMLSLSGCIVAQNTSGVTSALYTDWNDRDPISRVNNEVSSAKTGKACVTNILSIVATGDSSIEAAKKEGGIKNVSYVDRTYNGFWLFYQKGCTIVKGN